MRLLNFDIFLLSRRENQSDSLFAILSIFSTFRVRKFQACSTKSRDNESSVFSSCFHHEGPWSGMKMLKIFTYFPLLSLYFWLDSNFSIKDIVLTINTDWFYAKRLERLSEMIIAVFVIRRLARAEACDHSDGSLLRNWQRIVNTLWCMCRTHTCIILSFIVAVVATCDILWLSHVGWV